MKIIKLTKRMLKMYPSDLLIKLEANNPQKNVAYPMHVYFSKEDYKELKKNLIKRLVKQNWNKKERILSISFEMFNYGPNESLGKAIRPGYALIDEEAIKAEIVKEKILASIKSE